jgi:pimeloyl-ACP methyl ester carboxylesterase
MSEERIVRFGPDACLVGIATEPSGPKLDVPPVLLWNVGINHHIGPYRVFVDLARALAHAGIRSFRFDISGMGDSQPSKGDKRSDKERGLGDIQSAIDVILRQTGQKKVILVGFCSSVDGAHQVAVRDERVAGVVYLEGYYFKTLGYYLRYPRRLFSVDRWARFVRNRAERWQSRGRPLSAPAPRVFVRDYPTPESLDRDLNQLAGRGVKMLFLYVEGDSKYVYREQLFEFLGNRNLLGKIELEFWPEADHTFYLSGDRSRVVERVVRFARNNFLGDPKASQAELSEG